MQIDRMKTGTWGKIMAFFDVKTSEGLIVKGFKLIDGSKGPFVASPSKKGNDGEYYDDVFMSKELRSELNDLALAEHNKLGAGEPRAAQDDHQPSGDGGGDGEYDDIPF